MRASKSRFDPAALAVRSRCVASLPLPVFRKKLFCLPVSEPPSTLSFDTSTELSKTIVYVLLSRVTLVTLPPSPVSPSSAVLRSSADTLYASALDVLPLYEIVKVPPVALFRSVVCAVPPVTSRCCPSSSPRATWRSAPAVSEMLPPALAPMRAFAMPASGPGRAFVIDERSRSNGRVSEVLVLRSKVKSTSPLFQVRSGGPRASSVASETKTGRWPFEVNVTV